MKTRKNYFFYPLVCFLFIYHQQAFAQYPKLEIELKTNLSYLTCLDNFELEAKQINWQDFDFTEQEFLFHEINFTTPDTGFAVSWIQGAGETGFFLKTYNSGKTWNFDETLGMQFTSHLQTFGKDTVVLLGKNQRSWYVYGYNQYHSFDGGTTWDSIQTNLNIDPQKYFFVKPELGFCVDVNGQTYQTTDMGITWETRGKIEKGSNIKVYFLNETEGFLLTTNVLFKTSDAGNTWQEVDLPSEIGFTDLAFINNIGFITAKLGIILKSEDYGQSWSFCNTRLYPNLNKVEIISADSVFVVGDQGTILFSENGGTNWQQQFHENQQDLRTFFRYNNDHIFAAGNFTFIKFHPPVQLTESTWEPAELIISQKNNKIKANAPESLWFSVHAEYNSGEKLTDSIIINIQNPGIFVSRDSVANQNKQVQLHTLNDAGSWAMSTSEMYETWYHDIEFINSKTGFIIGQFNEKGIILKSTDGGENWFHIPQKIKTRLDDVQFVNEKTGYASGYQGYMVKTVDGGNTWFEIETPSNASINTISFVNENLGFAAADGGKILKTVNGGQTWEISELNYDFAFKILFLDENKGFLLHNYSGFWRTLNGGKSWQEVEHDRYFDVMDIQFVNDKTGYVVGAMLGPFFYIKTTDGGLTWNQKIFPRWTLTTYNTVFFEDEFTGYVFDAIGEVLKTGDGGQNWFILDTLRHPGLPAGSTGYNINAFKFTDSNKGIGLGNGHIFHFERSEELQMNWWPQNEIFGKNSAHPFVSAGKKETYFGEIKRYPGCESVDFVEVPVLTSKNRIANAADIKVYPVPARDILTLASAYLPKFEEIELWDISGKKVFSAPVEGKNRITICPNVRAGVYTLKCIGNENTLEKKVVFY